MSGCTEDPAETAAREARVRATDQGGSAPVARLQVIATMADGSTETLLAEHAVEPVEITQLPTYEVPFMFEPLRYRELKFQVAVKFSGPFNIRTQPPAPAEQESTARPADNGHPHELVDALANELLLGCGPLDYTPAPGMGVMGAWRTKVSEALHALRQDGWTVTATPPGARPRPGPGPRGSRPPDG